VVFNDEVVLIVGADKIGYFIGMGISQLLPLFSEDFS
jgi:hypothetical protein